MAAPQKPLVMGAGPSLPPPTFADLVAAFAILTSLPGERPGVQSDRFARACLFFPVVGLTVGVLLAATHHVLAPFCGGVLLSTAVVAVWVLLTLPTTDLTSGGRQQRLLTVALLVGKAAALGLGSQAQELALVLAPVLGRWTIVVLGIGARDANAPGRKFNPAIAFREFGWTSVFTGAALAWSADAVGILIFVAAAATVLALRLLCHRFLGGVRWTSLCLSAHLIEALLLTAFTAI